MYLSEHISTFSMGTSNKIKHSSTGRKTIEECAPGRNFLLNEVRQGIAMEWRVAQRNATERVRTVHTHKRPKRAVGRFFDARAGQAMPRHKKTLLRAIACAHIDVEINNGLPFAALTPKRLPST